MAQADGAPHVLIIEDEETLAASIAYNLTREGHRVTIAADGSDGLQHFRTVQPDLVVLDLMLPSMSGLDVLRQIRNSSRVPVIIVTAKDTEADTVIGLELGADDYVTKPFSVRELVSRVGAQLRRGSWSAAQVDGDEVLRAGRIEMNIDRHEVLRDGDLIEMRPKEFELLESLVRRRNRLATRELLLEEVWGSPFFGDSKTLDVHVRRIRTKIEDDPSNPKLIVTVRGLGYKFVDDDE